MDLNSVKSNIQPVEMDLLGVALAKVISENTCDELYITESNNKGGDDNQEIVFASPESLNDSVAKDLEEFFNGPQGNDETYGSNHSTRELGSEHSKERYYDQAALDLSSLSCNEITKYYSCINLSQDLNETDNINQVYIGFRTSTPIEFCSQNLHPMIDRDDLGSMSTINHNFSGTDYLLRESGYQCCGSYIAKEHRERKGNSSALEFGMQNLQPMVDKDDLVDAKMPDTDTDFALRESVCQYSDESYMESEEQRDRKRISAPLEFCLENNLAMFDKYNLESKPTIGHNFSDTDFPLRRSDFDYSEDSHTEREHRALMLLIGRAFSSPDNYNNSSGKFNEGCWSPNKSLCKWYKDKEICSPPVALF